MPQIAPLIAIQYRETGSDSKIALAGKDIAPAIKIAKSSLMLGENISKPYSINASDTEGPIMKNTADTVMADTSKDRRL